VTGTPSEGTYQFTPVRHAQAQQVLSTGFQAKDEPIGTGKVHIRHGGFIDESLSLDLLNGGSGVRRGKIKITDRAGNSEEVDLRFIKTIDDVVSAINSTSGIDVTATVSGDSIKLTDTTGQTTSNLKVQEVGTGSTAADLGLSTINVAANEAIGNDLLQLHDNLSLSDLNDGNGVSFPTSLPDLNVSLRDGSNLLVDFQHLGVAEAATATTDAQNGTNASLTFTAVNAGADYNGVEIRFVDDGSVTKGNETAVYDETNKTLTFKIQSGASTADDVLEALSGSAAENFFTAERASGGTGQGVVSTSDTVLSAGGVTDDSKTELTLGDLIETINAVDPTKLKAQYSASGDQIELIDLSTDTGGTFQVTSALTGSVAEDLGLTGTAVGDTITSDRLMGGLKSPLLRNLNGGKGFEPFGSIDFTDRSGATATIDLSSAETLEDVIDAINSESGINLEATINRARNGIEIIDRTGATASNLIIASADAQKTAESLGIAIDAAQNSVDSQSLNLQVLSEQSKLEDLFGGKGIAKGTFSITDSDGNFAAINLNEVGIETVGDLLDKINGSTASVMATINDAGDGIKLVDLGTGEKTMEVKEIGDGKTAGELGILGQADTIFVDSQPQQVLSGSTTMTIEIEEDETLEDLVKKIEDLDIGISASIFSDGSGATPHRLSISSQKTGSAGELLIDTSEANFSFEEISKAQDALLLFGASDNDSAGLLVSSSTNTFDSVIDGLTLAVNGTTGETVTVSVTSTPDEISSQMNLFVSSYNSLVDTLEAATFFSGNGIDTGDIVGGIQTGVLFGSVEALRVETEISQMITNRFFGVGSIQSMAEIGLNVRDDGKIEFDQTKLESKFATDPDAVEEFFTKEDVGVSAKFDKLLEQLAGQENSLLVNRAKSLQDRITYTDERIAYLGERLDRERTRLEKMFYNMELSISKIQQNQQALSAIQPLPPLNTTNNSA
ncbi:MAG: flagellar filament capping protein FliD, partial [Pirellulaceae bacterium]|nr:flagellar filament capping protein FliD [Pirellulaceae bacterium]